MIDTHLTGRAGRRADGTIGPADEAILQLLHRYPYLTARQVQRLRYGRGSLSYVQLKLRLLDAGGFLTRFYPPRAARAGSSPAVYRLAARGRRLLRQAGCACRWRTPRSRDDVRSFLFLTHTLAAIDVLIAAELLTRHDARLRLARLLTEPQLRRRPAVVTLADGSRTTVIPDGWLDLRLAGRGQIAVALELDRGTTEQRRWRRKIRALLAWANGPYQQRFGTTSLTVAVVATPGPARQAMLRRWTEAELEQHGQAGAADLFRFAGMRPARVTPRALFQEPRWQRPFATKLIPLLPRLEEEPR